MPTVSLAAASVWLNECGRHGIDAEALLASQGMAMPHSADAGTMPLRSFVAMTEAIARDTGQPSLGWRVGFDFDLRETGDLGRAMLSSATLGAAVRRLGDYFGLLQDAAELTVRREDDFCLIAYRILDPDIWPRHQDAIFTLAIICRLIQCAAGACWDQVELHLEQDDAGLGLDLARRTSLNCYSGGEANIIRFPAAFLELPLTCDPAIIPPDLRALSSHIVQKRRETGIELRVRALIYQQLGNCQIDQERIASRLGMSSRTLRRRLADENLSFQHIVDDCRMRQAAHEFRLRRHMSIAQTALRLGYSEHSTFTRAFSRWSGMSPQMFIRNQLTLAAAVHAP